MKIADLGLAPRHRLAPLRRACRTRLNPDASHCSRCAFAALLIAAGCSKDKDVEPPAALVKFPATLPVKHLWGDKVGGGKKQVKLRLGLGPAVDNGLVFAASDKGELLAVNLEYRPPGVGQEAQECRCPPGPAAGFGMVVVGSSKGTVIALDGATRARSCGARGSIPNCCPRRRSARRSW